MCEERPFISRTRSLIASLGGTDTNIWTWSADSAPRMMSTPCSRQTWRQHGISDATFYKYKAKFGGMNVSDAKKLRAIEDENNRLKRMLADAMLDNAAMKDLATKNY